jgi:predicted nucleic acid-binding protein
VGSIDHLPRFRWASLQLQNLTSFKLDADIRNRLGKLPSTLEDLYADHYEILSTSLDEFGKAIVMNVLSWLLCAQRTMKTMEFLAAISITPGVSHEPVSREQVLDICNNLVIFDAQLDTFRFAHLSVREFLEKQAAFSITFTNTLVAEICISHLLSNHPVSLHNKDPHIRRYSNVYWATHSQLAASARSPARLGQALQDLLLCDAVADSALSTWLSEVKNPVEDFSIGYNLETKLEDCRAGSASALFVAASFDLSEITEMLYRNNKNWPRNKNESNKCLLEVCAWHGSCNTMSLLLDLYETSAGVTERVIMAAAGNSGSGEKVMALLLKKRGKEIQITEGVVKAAASNYRSGKKVMALLLEQQAQSIIDPTKVIMELARSFDEKCIALLLTERENTIQISKEVVKAAAGNSSSGEEVMALLLKERGKEVQISDEVVKAAAGNSGSGEKVMALLLKERGKEVQITEEVVKVAAGNYSSGKNIMALLLKERGKEVQITEEVVKAAAGNSGSGEKVIALLLKERGKEVQITERVVKTAAGNSGSGEEVMALLLKEREKEVQISEEIVKAAAGNSSSGEEVIALLLKERGKEVKITEGVVKAAAGNYSSGKRVMALLLKQQAQSIIDPTQIVTELARSFDEKCLVLLLIERGNEIQISEEIVKAAAGNYYRGEKVIALLFKERGKEVKITEGVVKAAAGNYGSGKRVMALLLEQQVQSIIHPTQVIIELARSFDEKYVALLLKERGNEIQISEEVVKAAAGNSVSGKKIMALLLEQQVQSVVHPTQVITELARSFDEKYVAILLKERGNEIQISDELVKAAAGNVDSGIKVMALLFEVRGEDVKITEEVLSAAKGEALLFVLERLGGQIMTNPSGTELMVFSSTVSLPLSLLDGHEQLTPTLSRFRLQYRWYYLKVEAESRVTRVRDIPHGHSLHRKGSLRALAGRIKRRFLNNGYIE